MTGTPYHFWNARPCFVSNVFLISCSCIELFAEGFLLSLDTEVAQVVQAWRLPSLLEAWVGAAEQLGLHVRHLRLAGLARIHGTAFLANSTDWTPFLCGCHPCVCRGNSLAQAHGIYKSFTTTRSAVQVRKHTASDVVAGEFTKGHRAKEILWFFRRLRAQWACKQRQVCVR